MAASDDKNTKDTLSGRASTEGYMQRLIERAAVLRHDLGFLTERRDAARKEYDTAIWVSRETNEPDHDRFQAEEDALSGRISELQDMLIAIDSEISIARARLTKPLPNFLRDSGNKRYNLLMWHQVGYWDRGSASIDLDRYLEYTHENIKNYYRKLTKGIIDEIKSMPTLFSYELPTRQFSRVG
jgi:hypothetical protein